MNTLTQQAQLRQKLSARLEQLRTAQQKPQLDAIVTHCEINERQGVGILLQRIGEQNQDILTIRSHNLYDGVQDFGKFNFCLKHDSQNQFYILNRVSQALKGHQIRRILSVPYFTDDVLSTIALKDLYDVPLCTYLMDDQNIYARNIPDRYIRELLAKSDLCLGISRELCQAYQQKYQVQFWWLPPVIPGKFIQPQSQLLSSDRLATQRGIIVGNIWSPAWLNRLRGLTRTTSIPLDWYGKPNRNWLKFEDHELQQDGITFRGYLPETELVAPLRQAPYAVVPTGAGDDDDDRPEIAKLSLPSRISFITAAGNTPILVVGRRDSVAAKFVEEFEIGVVCSYDANEFQDAVEYLCSAQVQQIMRSRIAELASALSADGIGEWIWNSLAHGRPINTRFEDLKPRHQNLTAANQRLPRFKQKLTDASVIITLNEVTEKHGTGALVNRIFAGTPRVFSIRSHNHYGADHQFGDVSIQLTQGSCTRHQAFQNILNALRGCTVARAFCVPYAPDDLISSIAVKELFNVPLGTYIMDDQNIVAKSIPDPLMLEFLSKCSVRFATHPELRDAYEAKYNLKFWLLPAIVQETLISRTLHQPKPELVASKTGVLIGSIWSKSWFEMLQQATQGANIHLDWFGHNQYYWLKESLESIRQKGITSHGILPEPELAEQLKSYPYVIVPTGTLDERDDRQELSRLSLPGRIIFVMATAGTPVIILGSPKTGAARFVQRFGIGTVCDYDAEQLRAAVEHVTTPTVQRQMREQALAAGPQFSAVGIRDWVWNSLAKGEPSDQRFEQLFPDLPDEVE
ncbi:MAG: beta-1,6-galactofuranosyltransferase [Elainella sp. C42_A2020_010]|nr:beta-1,6-galactofuranosyltransferase [Elainella sp. C42_A2020_010]